MQSPTQRLHLNHLTYPSHPKKPWSLCGVERENYAHLVMISPVSMITMCLLLYYNLGTFESNSNDMKYPALLMEGVQKIAQDFKGLLKDKDKKKLAGYIQKLGFEDVAAMFYDLQPESGQGVNTISVNTRLPWT